MTESLDKVARYGQVVIGPPGAGKTTYCGAAKEFLTGTGRKVILVNLDPANDALPFTPDIDITDIISLGEAIDILKLGPNGGLLYCMEFIEKNFDLFEDRLSAYAKEEYYFIFDCPGQVELYTHHSAMKNILKKLLSIDFKVRATFSIHGTITQFIIEEHLLSTSFNTFFFLISNICTKICSVNNPLLNIGYRLPSRHLPSQS